MQAAFSQAFEMSHKPQARSCRLQQWRRWALGMIIIVILGQFAVLGPFIGLWSGDTVATRSFQRPASQGAIVAVITGQAPTSSRLLNFVLALRRDGGVCMPIFLVAQSNSPCLAQLLEVEAQALAVGQMTQSRCKDAFAPLSVVVIDGSSDGSTLAASMQAKRLKTLLFDVIPQITEWIMYIDIDIVVTGPIDGLVDAAVAADCREAGLCAFEQPERKGATYKQANPEPFHTGFMIMWRTLSDGVGHGTAAFSDRRHRQRGRGGLAPDGCSAFPDLRMVNGGGSAAELADSYTDWLVSCLPGNGTTRLARQVVRQRMSAEWTDPTTGRAAVATVHRAHVCLSAWRELIVSGRFERDQAALGELVRQGICAPKALGREMAVPVQGRWQLVERSGAGSSGGVPSLRHDAAALRFHTSAAEPAGDGAAARRDPPVRVVSVQSLAFPDLWVHWPSWRQWWMQGRDAPCHMQQDLDGTALAEAGCGCTMPAQPRSLPLLVHLTDFRLRTMPTSTRRAWQRALRLPLLPDRFDAGVCPAGPGRALLRPCGSGCPWFLDPTLAREAFDTGAFEGTESLPIFVRPVVAGARAVFGWMDWLGQAKIFLATIE